ERLHGVEVADRDVEEPAVQPVVDAGDEPLLVAAHLAPRDNVPALLELREEARDLVRRVLEVGIVKHQPRRGGGFGAGEQRLGLAEVPAVTHDAEPVPAGGLPARDLGGSIGRTIVDENDLPLQPEPLEGGAQLAHQLRNVLDLVVRGDDHGEVPPGAGGEARLGRDARPIQDLGHRIGLRSGALQTRFRMRADRIPSWSRYLATVRRAIWVPSSLRMFTIAWSVSGRRGSSSATSFWIFALIPRALTSSPDVVERPLEKKNLSGNTPRGVCTYFSFVTRETVDSCMLMTSATSRSVSGLRYCTPFSKNSRCRSTMKFITFSIVWRRCSIAWIIQLALFSLLEMNSLFSPLNLFLSFAISRYARDSFSRGRLVSFRNTRYSPSIFSTTRSGMMSLSAGAAYLRPGFGSTSGGA